MSDVQLMDPREAFAELGRIKLADTDLAGVLDTVASLAKRTIPGAAEVSVTLVHGQGSDTAAFTGDLALMCDERQYELGHGPCMDAANAGTTLTVPDLTGEQRWPDYTRLALAAGVHSSVSIGLPADEYGTGALNVYATKPQAFDDVAVELAQTFAGYAAV